MRFTWSSTATTSPRRSRGSIPPTALVMRSATAPKARATRTGNATAFRSYPSYAWKRPSMTITCRPPRLPSTRRPSWPGDVEVGNPGTRP
jgi:hypothetical protein